MLLPRVFNVLYKSDSAMAVCCEPYAVNTENNRTLHHIWFLSCFIGSVGAMAVTVCQKSNKTDRFYSHTYCMLKNAFKSNLNGKCTSNVYMNRFTLQFMLKPCCICKSQLLSICGFLLDVL